MAFKIVVLFFVIVIGFNDYSASQDELHNPDLQREIFSFVMKNYANDRLMCFAIGDPNGKIGITSIGKLRDPDAKALSTLVSQSGLPGLAYSLSKCMNPKTHTSSRVFRVKDRFLYGPLFVIHKASRVYQDDLKVQGILYQGSGFAVYECELTLVDRNWSVTSCPMTTVADGSS